MVCQSYILQIELVECGHALHLCPGPSHHKLPTLPFFFSSSSPPVASVCVPCGPKQLVECKEAFLNPVREGTRHAF